MSEKQQTISMVDDNAVNRTILCRLLGQDYAIVEAENGQQALDTLETKNRQISAILLDLVMPVLDGYGFLKQVKVPRCNSSSICQSIIH